MTKVEARAEIKKIKTLLKEENKKRTALDKKMREIEKEINFLDHQCFKLEDEIDALEQLIFKK